MTQKTYTNHWDNSFSLSQIRFLAAFLGPLGLDRWPALGDTKCDVIYCAANQHVVTNVCQACPSGATNVAGNDASGQAVS
jgi:hypothetical protein